MNQHRKEQGNKEDSAEKDIVHADNVLTSGDQGSADADPEKRGGFQGPYRKSPAEKKLLRKIGYTFLPVVTLIVMVQFADMTALAISAVLGIYTDTGISGSEFSWLGSIFFLGYLIYQIPNQILLQKLPIGRYLGVCLLLMGVIMLCTAQGNTFPQLAALRFLLGVFEASCLPCIYLIVANLYRREEQTFYFGVVIACQGVGSIFGNLIALGVSYMGNRRGIIMWRWNHIIFGVITVVLGIVTFFFLVDGPRSKLLRLTKEEEHIVSLRTEDNAVVRTNKIKGAQMIEAIKEPRLYLICIAVITTHMQTGGLLIFSAQFIQTLGDFTSTESILLKLPGGVASAVLTILASVIANKIHQVAYVGVFMCVISLSGVLILAAVPDGSVKLLGYYLSWGMSGASALLAATVGMNVSGYTKKILYNSCLVAAGTIGSFIGPLVMLEREKPRYITGMIVYCVGNGLAIFCFLINRMIMARENKRRLANPPEHEPDVTLGLTDVEDKTFVYKL
ncbi:major facilitator superfamily domain-containing protein [Zychaea mexicana]|uniref:major facilitator superfamily domain-containing protein n=1 Tax=Zychaea mexicana TaxID=64656 RepID=UPI0022FF0415|nr:major facilitator superfamily domain-containing protein [Zychaea mexicana]KAI9496084.1 major facilitator superfamily domain-containing protein [Zychaea mexicana]